MSIDGFEDNNTRTFSLTIKIILLNKWTEQMDGGRDTNLHQGTRKSSFLHRKCYFF